MTGSADKIFAFLPPSVAGKWITTPTGGKYSQEGWQEREEEVEEAEVPGKLRLRSNKRLLWGSAYLPVDTGSCENKRKARGRQAKRKRGEQHFKRMPRACMSSLVQSPAPPN